MRVRPRTVMPTSRVVVGRRRDRPRRRARRAGGGCPRRRAARGTTSALRPGCSSTAVLSAICVVEVEVEHGGAQLAGVVRDDAHRDDAVGADDRRRDDACRRARRARLRCGGTAASTRTLGGAQPRQLPAAVAARLVAVGEQQQAALPVAREERHGAVDGAAQVGGRAGARRRGQRSIGAGAPGPRTQRRRRRRRSARRARRRAPAAACTSLR